MNQHIIRCSFCGTCFGSVEGFESHIEKCDSNEEQLSMTSSCMNDFEFEYQVIFPDGTSEIRKGSTRKLPFNPESIRRKKTGWKSDADETVPS